MGGRGGSGTAHSGGGLATVESPPTPVSGHLSDKSIAENEWGGFNPDAPVNFHDDGPIGTAINDMGSDARMNVDGEPLVNVLGKMATDVVRGRVTPQAGVDKLKRLRDRLPAGSRARAELDRAIRHMDGPATSLPKVSGKAPKPLRQLVAKLHAIPLVRADPSKELDPLVDLSRRSAAGQIGGMRLVREVQALANRRHESLGDAGKFTIDRAVSTAVEALRNE